MEDTYKILRFRKGAAPEVVASGLSREEAVAHCRRDDTRGEDWFDGFEPDGGEWVAV